MTRAARSFALPTPPPARHATETAAGSAGANHRPGGDDGGGVRGREDIAGAVGRAVCRFAGVHPPAERTAAGAAAAAVLAALTRELDRVPLGVLVTPDELAHAADTGPQTKLIPPLDPSITAALAGLETILAGLDPAGLRALAVEVRLDRPTTALGAARAWDADEYTGKHGDGPGFDQIAEVYDQQRLAERRQRREARTTALVTGLSDTPASHWHQLELATLRAALRLVLARVGDAFLTASEWQPPPLSWQPTVHHHDRDHDRHRPVPPAPGAGWMATQLVPGAAHPLEAHLWPDPPRQPPPPTLFDPPQPEANPTTDDTADLDAGDPDTFDAEVVAGGWYRWEVGWRDAQGQFGVYGARTRASLPAARFAAEVTVAELAAQPERVRMPLSGALLVPRTGGTRSLDARVVDLEALLIAVMSEHRGEARGPVRWQDPPGRAITPHSGDDGELHSMLAVIFDHLVLPLPAPGSSADHGAPGSAALAEFLDAEAVTLTPAAQCYLAGTSDAGPGPQPLAARHAAGWRAVLDHDPDWVTLELPTLEHPVQLGALGDVARLEAHLTGGSAPREPRARREPF